MAVLNYTCLEGSRTAGVVSSTERGVSERHNWLPNPSLSRPLDMLAQRCMVTVRLTSESHCGNGYEVVLPAERRWTKMHRLDEQEVKRRRVERRRDLNGLSEREEDQNLPLTMAL